MSGPHPTNASLSFELGLVRRMACTMSMMATFAPWMYGPMLPVQSIRNARSS